MAEVFNAHVQLLCCAVLRLVYGVLQTRMCSARVCLCFLHCAFQAQGLHVCCARQLAAAGSSAKTCLLRCADMAGHELSPA